EGTVGIAAAIKVATPVGIAMTVDIVVLPDHDARAVGMADTRSVSIAGARVVEVAPHVGVGVALLGITLLLRLLAIRPLLAALGLALLGGEALQVGIARLGVGVFGRSRLGVAVLG